MNPYSAALRVGVGRREERKRDENRKRDAAKDTNKVFHREWSAAAKSLPMQAVLVGTELGIVKTGIMAEKRGRRGEEERTGPP